MENGYPLAVRTEEYVYPRELKLLSIVAGRETLLGQCAGWGNMILFAMSGVGHGGYWPRCPEPLVVDLGLSKRGHT